MGYSNFCRIMLKKSLIIIVSVIGVLTLGYFAGPEPPGFTPNGELPEVTSNLLALEQEVDATEAATPGIKANNEARIVWVDSTRKEKTAYSIVYLHGFGASQAEGDPVHVTIAKKYGCNLYLSRLQEQGIDTDSTFKQLTAENYLASAKRAVAIGKQLGDTVIIMATSTGGALGLYIASAHPEIKAVITYSPIIDTYDGTLFLLRNPWGRQIGKMVIGGDYEIENREGLDKQYWSRVYYIDGYIALSDLVGETMVPEIFQKVKCPVFLGYYYKNEEEQDHVVSVPKMLEMFDELGTPADKKRKVAFPEAGEHVIGSYIRSNDWQGVLEETDLFMREILRMQPVLTSDPQKELTSKSLTSRN